MPEFNERTMLAIKIAKQAGAKILEMQNGNISTKSKGTNDIVTIADTTSEKIITDTISSKFPNDGIISEEGSCKDSRSGYSWVTDPLDGTVNYSRSLSYYTVSVGYMKDGVPEGGAIFAPKNEELFVCERNIGAYLNNVKIAVSNRNLENSIATIGFNNRTVKKREWFNRIHSNLMENTVNVEKLFSPVISLCYVACGRTELHCELNCFLWDIIPAGLLIEEAGGKITQTDGKPIDFLQVENQCVLGTNRIMHENILNLIPTGSIPRSLAAAEIKMIY